MATPPNLGKQNKPEQATPPAARDRWRGTSTIIGWLIHLIRDRMTPNLREFLGERQPLVWAVALVIGIGVAYFAILFRNFIGYVQLLWLGTTDESVFTVATQLPWWIILAAPALGGLFVGLYLHYLMPGRRPHGVADVIEARALSGCRIPAQVGLGSALVSAISLGAGASAGREGPVVHLGATFASVLVDLFKFSHAARRTLLACGEIGRAHV